MSTLSTQVCRECNKFNCIYVNTWYMHFYLFFLHRLVKEITYREFQRYHGNHPSAPVISDVNYKSGMVVKCPMRWTKGALEALHEAVENYMVGLMEDANL